MVWVDLVELHGMETARKIPSYHDEPLKGQLMGKRSIKLNKGYRAIYQEDPQTNLIQILILEISKHEYKK